MESKNFDDIIRKKMQEHENAPADHDWELFEQLYNKAEAAVITGDSFDSIVREKMQELEETPVQNDWELFEQLYDQAQEDIDDLDFDAQVSNKLTDHTIPYNRSHWALMKERLEKEEFIRTSIYFSKIVEAACIFLLLFTFLNVFPHISRYDAPKSIVSDIKNDSDFSDHVESSHNPTQTNNEPLEANIDGTKNNSPAVENSAKVIPFIPKKAVISNNDTEITSDQVSATAQEIDESRALLASKVRKGDSYSIEEEARTVEERIPLSIASVESGNIELLELRRSFYFPLIPSWLNRNDTEKSLTVSIAPTLNVIGTPSDNANDLAGYLTDALGSELGIKYGIKKNNLEIETGLSYGKRSYQPDQRGEVTGSFFENYTRSSLKNMSFDVFGIPLNLKYQIKEGDNDWNIYAMVGTSINMIAKSDYTFEENGQPVAPPSSRPPSGQSRSSELFNKNFTQGVFEGGNFSDNLFISLDYGIGLEKKLSNSTYLIIAPTMKQHIGLKGIGPNRDKIHSFSLNLGVKKSL